MWSVTQGGRMRAHREWFRLGLICLLATPVSIASSFTILPVTQPNLAFNVNDFAPIGFVGEVPNAIAVSPALPVNSLPELIAYSRTQQGGLNVAIPNRGGIPH